MHSWGERFGMAASIKVVRQVAMFRRSCAGGGCAQHSELAVRSFAQLESTFSAAELAKRPDLRPAAPLTASQPGYPFRAVACQLASISSFS